MIRIASWLLASRVRSSAGQPRPTARVESTAIARATRTKRIRIPASSTGCSVERKSVTRRIGPNSPAAPAPSRKVPKRVSSSPPSRRIGISVPIAVVAIAEPV